MSTRKKSSSRKKKSKVKLNAKAVFALAVTVSVLCASFLAFSFFVLAKDDATPQVALEQTSTQKAQGAKKDSQSVKNTQASAQKTSSSQKEQTPAQKTQSSPKEQASAQKTQSSTKEQASAQKTQSSTKEQASAQKTQSSPKEQTPAQKTQSQPKVQTSTPKTQDTHVASIGSQTGGDKEIVEAKKPESPRFNIPPAVNGAKLCFVIDDAGENVANVMEYTTLPLPLTIAILPRVSHSAECAKVIRDSGKEAILHQPMQAVNLNMNPGPGAITGEMSTYEVADVLKENIRRIGPIKGMNNHEGSLITSDAIRIGAVLEVCAEEGIYFIDSRTALAEANKVRQAALERDMGVLERNAPFIDNVVSREAMLSEILRGLAVANKQGRAIMIGHVDKSVKILPKLLSELYPELKKAGYVVTVPSRL